MNLHKHARLTPRGRAILVQCIEQDLRLDEAVRLKAQAFERTTSGSDVFGREVRLPCKITCCDQGSARMSRQTPGLIVLSKSGTLAPKTPREPDTAPKGVLMDKSATSSQKSHK